MQGCTQLGSKPVVGEHVLFLSGNNVGDLAWATLLLTSWFGRRHIINLGDITAARGAEMHIILWNTLSGILGTPLFNI